MLLVGVPKGETSAVKSDVLIMEDNPIEIILTLYNLSSVAVLQYTFNPFVMCMKSNIQIKEESMV